MKKTPLILLSLSLVTISSLLPSAASAQDNVMARQVGNGIYEIAVDSEENVIYLASIGKRGENQSYIYKLDGETLAATDSIHLEKGAFGLGYNQKTKTLYTSNTVTNSVYAIDVRTNKVLAEISNGKEKSHTREIVVDHKKNLVYISDVGEESSIWVIDGKKNKYLHSIDQVGRFATGLALDKKGKNIYVTLMGEGKVIGIDLKSKKRTFEVALDTAASPINLVLDEEKNMLYVSDSKLHKVYAISTVSGKVEKTIEVDTYPIGIELDIKNNRIYTANREGHSITAIDRNTLTVIKHVATDGLSNTVKTNPKTGVTYVTNKQVSLVNRKGEPTGNEPLKNGDTVSKINP